MRPRHRARCLAVDADAAGLLDVACRTVDSPFGPLLIAVTDAGVARVAFEREDHERVLAHLATDISPRILRAADRTEEVARQLDEYFDGRRRNFDLAVDLQLAHGFRHEVLVHLRAIAYGRTESYAEVARARPDGPPRCGRRRARARTTRSRSSCPATASSAVTDRSASTSAAPR